MSAPAFVYSSGLALEKPVWSAGSDGVDNGDDSSSCASVESDCPLDFPDPESSLIKTQDSLSTQPDWKQGPMTEFYASKERRGVSPSSPVLTTFRSLKDRNAHEGAYSDKNRSSDTTHESSRPKFVSGYKERSKITAQSICQSAHNALRSAPKVPGSGRKKYWGNSIFLAFVAFAIAAIAYTNTAGFKREETNPSISYVCRLTGGIPLFGCSLKGSQVVDKRGPPVNNPILVQLQIDTLHNVIENSQGIGTTAVEIRRSGIVMSELETLLEASDLAGKHELAEAIAIYRRDSFHVGRGLEQFRSNLLATLGSLVVLSNNLANEVEAIKRDSSTLVQWIRRIIPKFSDQVSVANDLYQALAEFNRDELEELHTQAVNQLHALDDVGRDLRQIHSLSTHGKRRKDQQLDDLLAELFTILGGNQGRVTKYREDLALLGVVERGYREARARVEAIVQQLEMITLDLESASGKAAAASKLASLASTSPMESVRILKQMTAGLLETAKERLQIGSPSNVVQRYVERD